MVTPKSDVDKHKYAENVEEQIIRLANVKTIPKCPNYDGNHIAGSGEWEAKQNERKIKEVQTKEKVGRRRAIQLLSGQDETPANKSTKYPTHSGCKMNPEQKNKFSPWTIEKCFTHEL